jgi:phenylpropionate dioxygenase-like ring-hydroxylating dioxygenase large terminal subunit
MSQIESSSRIPLTEVRPDFVPKDAYISREFLEAEKRRLWPRAWQVACREEEIANVGNYVTYDIGDESLIVVRVAPDTIKCFFNVCPHRGRRLTEGAGATQRFHCQYHGWQWNLDGSNARVLDHEDWEGCPGMRREDLSLTEAKVSSWAGFVFINMDPNAEPLAEWLDPVPAYIDPFEIEKMRYRWYKSIRLPCNWKVALEAFNEGYHVAATHPQILPTQGDDVTRSFTFGKHGMFGYPTARRLFGAPSPRLSTPVPEDVRPGMVRGMQQYEETLKAITSARDVEAAHRLLTETSADTPHIELLMKLMQFQKEAALASGAGWPDISLQQLAQAGNDWHVFPNLIFLMAPGGTLAYRARPDSRDPDYCYYDIWSLVRYAPGAEPKLKREFYYGEEDWDRNAIENFGLILAQDFQNMKRVQSGMKSSAFRGARTNPLQESVISNFHRVLHEYVTGA